MQRIRIIDSGRLMVVSDLQGNLRDFQRVLNHFDRLCLEQQTTLVVCGDLIHAQPGEPDHSLEMLDALISRISQGESIIYLMGNHELAHVMHWDLFKAGHNYTRPLEKAFENQRKPYAKFLNSLPFALITCGGLLINHSGISAALGGQSDPLWDLFLVQKNPYFWLENLDFQKEFSLPDSLAESFDPSFGERLLKTPPGQILWEAFMNKNELSYSRDYEKLLRGTLRTFSARSEARILVSAHLEEPQGARVLHGAHLRICSSQGAEDSAKKFLWVEADKNFHDAHQVLERALALW